MDVSQPRIQIQVHTKYVEEQSNPELARYIFAYIITIKNHSSESVQLLSRRWLITDANGKQISVEGDGVVGQQPFIDAGDEYTYSSGTALDTPVGVMQGQYIMHDAQSKEFVVEIEPFRLAVPNILN
ncbi:Co2+/Mg2+ efflux protein ApaG [Vibrio sp. IRLE0018]|uniref:Co2+/Mg2+ efflux protein ApaG n=1 Tax=Vibrio TaxID=662 RepID=UPI00159373A5|nr:MULTISPECIES: Co2+/Mg2+ efflux protein ApaG [Vibrio]MCF8780629.1 Co2+/Mg2+ efflux protein ApaG [Vibrio floridensis]NVC62343.1 Co2+/Mg2+ efflux protein ApaG [Vibrio sp. 05-20-BW147]HAS6349244.1 Co2+/Mg2+ efflux protein ApaG [Vibrio vulnificus]